MPNLILVSGNENSAAKICHVSTGPMCVHRDVRPFSHAVDVFRSHPDARGNSSRRDGGSIVVASTSEAKEVVSSVAVSIMNSSVVGFGVPVEPQRDFVTLHLFEFNVSERKWSQEPGTGHVDFLN